MTRPRFPLALLAAWLAFVADLGGTAALLFSDAPGVLKVAVAGGGALGLYTIVIWYVARAWESAGDDEGDE
jgi:hypothetical protein